MKLSELCEEIRVSDPPLDPNEEDVNIRAVSKDNNKEPIQKKKKSAVQIAVRQRLKANNQGSIESETPAQGPHESSRLGL